LILLPLLFGLMFVLIALVSGNNLSVCTGALIGSRISSKRTGISIAVLGFALGLFLQGAFLKKGVVAILPVSSAPLLIIVLSIAIAVFLLSDKLRVPQSLSINFTSMLLGMSIALHNVVNWYFLALIIAFWVLVPLASIFSMPFIMHYVERATQKGSVWKKVHAIKLLLVVVSFFTAFTLGANTLGFLYEALPSFGISMYKLVVAIAAIIVGGVFLSGGEVRRVGNDIISMRYLNSIMSQAVSAIEVEVATLFGVPLSNTQTFTASLYGIGYGYKTRLMKKKPAYTILFMWIGGALLSFALSFALVSLASISGII